MTGADTALLELWLAAQAPERPRLSWQAAHELVRLRPAADRVAAAGLLALLGVVSVPVAVQLGREGR